MLLGDLGGYLGLLLGASIVTVCEVVDLIIYNIAKSYLGKRRKSAELDYRSSRKSTDLTHNTLDKSTETTDKSDFFDKFV